MERNSEIDNKIKDGFIDGIPIVIGYLPIAVAFGILSRTTGITMLNTILFSAVVFAGASQFIALNLLALSVGIGEIILTTLLLNFRHFLMSASIAVKMKKNIRKWSAIIGFGITDEVFSVASFKKGLLTKEYMIALEFSAYSSWVGGTALGYLVGGVLPTVVKISMGVALYAMFAAILVPEVKKSSKAAILASLSGILNVFCKHFLSLPQGWSIVISVILVSLLGLYIFRVEELEEYE